MPLPNATQAAHALQKLSAAAIAGTAAARERASTAGRAVSKAAAHERASTAARAVGKASAHERAKKAAAARWAKKT